MKKYVVRDREAGNPIEWVDSIEEGKAIIQHYEQQDIEEGIYTPDFYEVTEM